MLWIRYLNWTIRGPKKERELTGNSRTAREWRATMTWSTWPASLMEQTTRPSFSVIASSTCLLQFSGPAWKSSMAAQVRYSDVYRVLVPLLLGSLPRSAIKNYQLHIHILLRDYKGCVIHNQSKINKKPIRIFNLRNQPKPTERNKNTLFKK